MLHLTQDHLALLRRIHEETANLPRELVKTGVTIQILAQETLASERRRAVVRDLTDHEYIRWTTRVQALLTPLGMTAIRSGRLEEAVDEVQQPTRAEAAGNYHALGLTDAEGLLVQLDTEWADLPPRHQREGIFDMLSVAMGMYGEEHGRHLLQDLERDGLVTYTLSTGKEGRLTERGRGAAANLRR